ncbi:MAG TPA: hypothetical protein VFD27_23250 [Chthoniobacteraceae bacterium]|nr:hypothetical protein [Chthoniobacteraceae bacterium]
MDPPARVTWQIPVFAAGARTVDVRDVIAAALLRGELDGVIAAARAPVDGDVQALCDAWRYERDLITAEETERWLEARGLTLEEFDEFILRRSKDSDETVDLADPEAREKLRIELLLSGEFDRLALRLSWRFAAWLEAPAEPCEEDRRTARLPRQWGCDERWLDEMLAVDAAWHRERDALLTPTALQQTLATLRLPLTRLEFEALDLESLDAAREAFLCVRDDGLTIAEVARDGGYTHSRVDALLEELSEECQQHFLSAIPGSVLPPLVHGDGFQLCHLIKKSEPELADARIRTRVEQQLITQHFSELAARHIRWLLFPPPAA